MEECTSPCAVEGRACELGFCGFFRVQKEAFLDRAFGGSIFDLVSTTLKPRNDVGPSDKPRVRRPASPSGAVIADDLVNRCELLDRRMTEVGSAGEEEMKATVFTSLAEGDEEEDI